MGVARSVTVASAGQDADGRAATRQQILAATRRLLAQGEAFARLSVQRIVDAAGVSRATFYLHFRTKRELIAALAQSETGEWRNVAAPFLDDVGADRAALADSLAQLLTLWREHRAVLAGIIELAEYDADTRAAWRDTIHGIAAVISASLRLRRPEMAADDVESLGRLIAWSGERFLHQEAGAQPCQRDRQLVESLTEMIWRLCQRQPAGDS